MSVVSAHRQSSSLSLATTTSLQQMMRLAAPGAPRLSIDAAYVGVQREIWHNADASGADAIHSTCGKCNRVCMYASLPPFSLQSMSSVIALSLTDGHAAAASDTATLGQRQITFGARDGRP